MNQNSDWVNIKTNKGLELGELSNSCNVLLVFLRHFGCIFCQEALHDLKNIKERLASKGVELVLVHMTDYETAEGYMKLFDLADHHHVSDPTCTLYESFGLIKGKFTQLYGLRNWMRGFEIQRTKNLSYSTKQIGDGLQMPGVFVLRNEAIASSYIHRKIADRPQYLELIEKAN